MPARPNIVILSGSVAPDSLTESVARWCAHEILGAAATPALFTGADLDLPFYRPLSPQPAAARRFVDAMARCDGVVLVSPAYHGSVSGLLKNALDHLNELARDRRPFLDGRPVGCVALAGGTQGAAAALTAMRSMVHALRGWPTPLGVTAVGRPGPGPRPGDVPANGGPPVDESARRALPVMLDHVLGFARRGLPDPDAAHSAEPLLAPVATGAGA